MTAIDRFDPFERRITDAIDEIAAARPPEYMNDILRQTARSSQRPSWAFPERWLNVDTSVARPMAFGRFPLRALLALGLLTVLLAGLAIFAGSQQRVPAPFGPAGNGKLIFPLRGDIYVRNGLTGEQAVLIGAEGDQFAPSYAPDGRYVTYVTGSAEGDHFMLANADGSDPRQLALIPSVGNAQGAWRPDSTGVAFIYDVNGAPQLSFVSANGVTTVVDIGELVPLELSFMPPSGQRLLIRARVPGTEDIGLYTMALDGTDQRTVVAPTHTTFGTSFTHSGAVWSPDGRTIAYNGIERVTATDRTTAEYFRVHLVSADGSNDRVIAGPADPNTQENWPVFSPDGKWIAVQRWTFENGVAGATGWTAVMPADGSQVARDIGPHFEAAVDTGISKTWSPDSSKLLIHLASNQEVYSVDPLTGASERLPWTTELPDWQRVALP